MGPTFWDPSAIGIYKALNNRLISEFTGTLKRFIAFCTKVKLGLWFEAKQSYVSIQAYRDID